MSKLCRIGLAIAIGALLATASPAAAATHGDGPVARAAGCGDWTGAVAGWGRWLKSKSDCAVFGSPGWRVGYAWATQPGTNTRICVQALGYVKRKTGPGRRAKWFSMGCGTSGSGTVPWGNTAAVPTVRAKTQLGFLGGLYRWRH
jgi:hypothetical protein